MSFPVCRQHKIDSNKIDFVFSVFRTRIQFDTNGYTFLGKQLFQFLFCFPSSVDQLLKEKMSSHILLEGLYSSGKLFPFVQLAAYHIDIPTTLGCIEAEN